MATKDKPAQFDCYHNALPDEPMFILLARDSSAPELVEEWAKRRLNSIVNMEKPTADAPMVDEAINCAANMRAWRRANDGRWRNQPTAIHGTRTASKSLAAAFADVAEFHLVFDVPVLPAPAIPSQARVQLRRELLDEEVNRELLPAMDANDLPGIADGIADSIYILLGTALEYGIPITKIYDAVHAANMAKVDPTTGKVRRREDGKVLKPDGWTPPDIAALLSE